MTNEKSHDLEHDALNLEYTAEWRRQKAEEYPHDAQRNLDAAQLLERLALEVRSLDNSAIHRRLCALKDQIDDNASLRFCEEQADYIRRIGFVVTTPLDGEEFLNDMLETMLAKTSEDTAH